MDVSDLLKKFDKRSDTAKDVHNFRVNVGDEYVLSFGIEMPYKEKKDVKMDRQNNSVE